MEKKEVVKFWINSALQDISAMENLFQSGNFGWALFIGHLIIEKVLKARWIHDNSSEVPPKTHNLEKLVRETELELKDDDLAWLVQANDFNLETRYPDYRMEFSKRATREFSLENIQKIKELFACIHGTMQ